MPRRVTELLAAATTATDGSRSRTSLRGAATLSQGNSDRSARSTRAAENLRRRRPRRRIRASHGDRPKRVITPAFTPQQV